MAIVLLPSLFVALPAFQALFTDTFSAAVSGSGVWSNYWQSLLLSYLLGAIVTLIGFIVGLPMAILIARKKFGKMPSTVLDILVNIPLIVPSIALGVSLKFFWQSFAFIPEFLLLVFAHLAITYPYFVRSMSAAFERISLDMEEAARTLGAKPFGYLLLGISLFITLLSGLALAVIMSAFASDVRSATALVGYIYPLIFIPAMVLMYVDINTLPLAIKAVFFAIPYSQPIIASKAVIMNDYPTVVFGIIYVAIFTLVVMYVASRLFATEKILTAKLKFKGLKRLRKTRTEQLE